MKNIYRVFILCLVLCGVQTACNPVTFQPTATIPPKVTSPIQTIATQIITKTVAPTFTPSLILTHRPTIPYLISPLEIKEVPSLLKAALSVEYLPSFNGHKLQRITGWDYGLDDFDWMDGDHLLFYAVVGPRLAEWSLNTLSDHPVVINLRSQKMWVLAQGEQRGRTIFKERLAPRWSEKLGVLITSETKNSIGIYHPDGELIKSYRGDLLGVSPSATKILVADNTWTDLSSGKTVKFTWNDESNDSIGYMQPIWSPDETRVYSCCFRYGDAKTGKSFEITDGVISVDGEKAVGVDAFYGTWVLNGSYMLTQWGGVLDGRPTFVSLFDPATQTYLNLNAMIGIPYSLQSHTTPYCGTPSAAVGGNYVWLNCSKGSYLVDLTTFQFQAFPNDSMLNIAWSVDGKYALLGIAPTDNLLADGSLAILSATSKKLKQLPKDYDILEWHPKDDFFICLSNKGKTLFLLDAQTVAIQKEIVLPTEIQEMVWSRDGNHIALLANDSSLWQVDYPNLDNLKQLTSAMPQFTHPKYAHLTNESLIENLHWSPDGTSLAFIGGKDIYIVWVNGNP